MKWLNVVRTPELAFIRIMVACIVALVLGSLFWKSDIDIPGLSERSSYFAYGKGKDALNL